MKSLAGHLLIAPPQERELDFIGTVILLVQHSAEQAVGLVLNRPTTRTVKKAWTAKRRCRCEECVYSGGPISGPLTVLHTDDRLGEIEVLPGVYYSVKTKHLEELLAHATQPIKVFDSHFGWGPGQLEMRLQEGPWRILPATPRHVFEAGPDLWEELSQLG